MAHKPFIRTLRAQWLGQRLRELREERGMTLETVAEHLNRDRSALGRYERAEWPIQRNDVYALLDLYGFHRAQERQQLLSLAEEVWRTDRWDEDYGDVVDASFIDFPWLESRAARISSYNPLLLPGLFQTRAYAEAVIRSVEEPDAPDDLVARWIDLRMQRQRVFEGRRDISVSTVVEEAALRRPVGGRAVMAAQLRHLAEVARRSNVEIRVLPTGLGTHSALNGPFVLFTMPRPYPEVAYIENLGGRLYLEAPKSERFRRAYDRLRKVALDPHESVKLVATIAEEL
ncbi:helix-turn-helix transcriptional regulator [Plantactinospora sp. B24E8]|uniref:helix-turn-helix domain-containing protein n=1 Tax=Plantactinospora sp. B24E8 TaxID=3153567 RepID=UPI00325C65C8